MHIDFDWVKKWSLYSPLATAFKDGSSGEEYSYSLLYFLSCKLAAKLRRDFAVKPGDRVAVLSTNELEYLPLFFATQRLGAILVPVNFRLTAREVSHILEDSDAKLLVIQNQFDGLSKELSPSANSIRRWGFDGADGLRGFVRECVATFAHEKLMERQHLAVASPDTWQVPFESTEEDAVMILYTSGTTGAPKGALITNRMLFWNSLNTSLRLNLNQHDVSLSFLPLFHTGGWNVLLTPFVHRGAKTILLRKFDPELVLRLCESERATILFGVPTTMDMMAHSPRFSDVNLRSIRYAIVGGEPMPIELIRRWQDKGIAIRQGYGLTEFGPNVFSLNEEDAIRKIGSIGFANFYIDVRVVDAQGADVAAGEVGELLLRGPACTPGYWRNAKATEDTLRDGWLYTGDLVRVDAEGYFYVVGRRKEMFISGAENVYPVEIEQFLRTHPAIREAAVIGVPDVKWGEAGKAFVSLNEGAAVSEDDLRLFCQQGLAKFKIPKQFLFLPELPKGDSGKILKRELKSL